MNLLFGLGVHPDADRIPGMYCRYSLGSRREFSRGTIEAAAAGIFPDYLTSSERRLWIDMVLSAPKDVSLFWALASEETANTIEACHKQAVKETIRWMENNAVYTYTCFKNKYPVPRTTQGIVVAIFTRFSDDELRPHLQSHLVLSNSTQDTSGFWKAIDFKTFSNYRKAINEYYLMVLQYFLSVKAHVDFVQEIEGFGEKSWHVAGFQTRPVKKTLHHVYGVCGPKQYFGDFLEQEKSEFIPSRPNLRSLWSETLSKIPSLVGSPKLGHSERSSRAYNGPEPVIFEQIEKEARDELLNKYSFFSRHEIDEEVSKALRGYPFRSCTEIFVAHKQMVDELISTFVRLDRSDAHLPAALREGDNGLDRTRDDIVLTAEEILEEEKFSIGACRECVRYKASKITIWKHIISYRLRNIKRNRLNRGQMKLISHFTSSGKRVSTGIGPAGAGKTSAMRLVAEIWQAEGHRVIGLAPSAAAAKVLAKELGIKTSTVDKLTYGWTPESKGASPAGISSGDMLLVDEAGMTHTHNIYKLINIAISADAIVRFIGDPCQLDPVGLNGLFKEMTQDEKAKAAELEEVVRFQDPEEKAASIDLRLGEESCLKFYFSKNRIKIVPKEEILQTVVNAFLEDQKAGKESLVVALTNEEVDNLNQVIRDYYISTGSVDTDSTVILSRGEEASPGDYVIARKNEKFDPVVHKTGGSVYNGERFRIEEIEPDGSLRVTSVDPNSLVAYLPAPYVSDNVHLGYASTVHRSQGATVDTTHAIINKKIKLPALYVALTRGRKGNYAYISEADYEKYVESSPKEKVEADLKRILAAAHDPCSATAKRKNLLEEHNSDLPAARQKRLYAYGLRLATNNFIDDQLPKYVDTSSMNHYEYEKIRQTWKVCIKKGLDPRDLNNVDPSRINKLSNNYPCNTRGNLPPKTDHTDTELFTWLNTHRDEFT